MRKQMWMGTKGYETWVPMPAVDPTYTRAGYLSNTGLINGGVSIDQSKNAHMVYSLTWNKGGRDDRRAILDFADGVFDWHDGVNPIYFIDPVAADKNILPQHWATPALGSEDAPPLLIDNEPGSVLNGPSPWRLPARSAVYTQKASDATAKLYVPIPPGFTLWAGVVGDAAADGRVLVRDISGTVETSNTAALPTIQSPDGNWTTNSFARAAQRTGVQFELVTGSAATFKLTALTALVLPNGTLPSAHALFASGQGHSGCQFTTRPAQQPHSVPMDMTGLSAVLEEVGAYL